MHKKMLMAAFCWLISGTALAAGTTAQVTGTLHGVDAQKHKVNITHPAVPEFKWPAMRMDFSVGSGVALEGLKAGQKVQFTITHADSKYTITEIAPAH